MHAGGGSPLTAGQALLRCLSLLLPLPSAASSSASPSESPSPRICQLAVVVEEQQVPVGRDSCQPVWVMLGRGAQGRGPQGNTGARKQTRAVLAAPQGKAARPFVARRGIHRRTGTRDGWNVHGGNSKSRDRDRRQTETRNTRRAGRKSIRGG